jgi:hypothetical protein
MEAMFNESQHSWEHQMHKALAAFWATAGKEKIINYLNRPQVFITMRGNDPTFNEAMIKWEKEFKKDTGQAGGYKHGKRSNKRMKRSLKSKLTARKFSLKKRSKRKKKGKSKKRRKSIKIRI